MMPLAFVAGQRVPMQSTRLVRPRNDPLSTTLVGFSPDEERTEAGGVFTRASGSFSKLLSDRPFGFATVGTGGGLGPSLPATAAGEHDVAPFHALPDAAAAGHRAKGKISEISL